MQKTDVVIVGAGIAGLTASIYLKRANIDFVILENTLPGGMLNSLKDVDNFPGFSHSSGKDILLSLMNQIHGLDISINYGNVITILKDVEGFKVVSDKDIYLSKAVVIATGLSKQEEFINGEKEYFAKGVSYCATCDGAFFKDGVVAIYGNGNTALEEAIYLNSLVKHLYFIVNNDTLEGDAKSIETLKKSAKVEFIYDEVMEIKGDEFAVNSLLLKSGKSLNVDAIFPYVSVKKAGEFLKGLLPLADNAYIETDENMMSDIEGLYAIGDIRKKSVRQLVTASSDGAIASYSIIKYIKGRQNHKTE